MSRILLAVMLPFVLMACSATNSSNEQDLSFAFMSPAPEQEEPIASATGPGSCALFRDSIDRAEAVLDHQAMRAR